MPRRGGVTHAVWIDLLTVAFEVCTLASRIMVTCLIEIGLMIPADVLCYLAAPRFLPPLEEILHVIVAILPDRHLAPGLHL